MRVPLGVIGIIYGIAPQRHGGCRRAVPEVGQRLHPARRFRGHPFQPGYRRLRASGAARSWVAETQVQVVKHTDRAAVGELITMKEYVM